MAVHSQHIRKWYTTHILGNALLLPK